MGSKYSGVKENMSWNDRKKNGPGGELRKVRVGDIGRKTIKQYWHEMYNGIEPVHSNKFDEYMYKDEFHEYDWEGLKLSLLENGYDIYKYNPITVRPANTKEIKKNGKYFIIDGQHRAFLLREMFGEDHMIDVDVRDGKSSRHILYRMKEKPITHYIELVNGWLFPGYVLIYHTIPLIVTIVSFYLIQKYLPNNQLYKTLKKGVILSKINDISERLYMVVLNIINNTQMIAYLTLAVSISLYMLITDFYGIVIILILTKLITYILSKFKNDFINTLKEEKGDK